jgi:hypothetical protein
MQKLTPTLSHSTLLRAGSRKERENCITQTRLSVPPLFKRGGQEELVFVHNKADTKNDTKKFPFKYAAGFKRRAE